MGHELNLKKIRKEAEESRDSRVFREWFHPTDLEVIDLVDRLETAEKKVAAGLAVLTEYGEQPHSNECGSGDCCQCTLQDFSAALNGDR